MTPTTLHAFEEKSRGPNTTLPVAGRQRKREQKRGKITQRRPRQRVDRVGGDHLDDHQRSAGSQDAIDLR